MTKFIKRQKKLTLTKMRSNWDSQPLLLRMKINTMIVETSLAVLGKTEYICFIPPDSVILNMDSMEM